MATTGDQLQGCTIPDKCMLHTNQDLARRDAFCENDLGCICKVDNHLGNNSLFSSECLLKECTDGHGRKSFLRDWIESCRQVGKSGWDDMPWEWEPYLPNEGQIVVGPTTYVNKPSETVSSAKASFVLVVTSTAAVATSLLVTSVSSSLITTSGTTSTTRSPSTLTNNPSTVSTFNSPEQTSVVPQPAIFTSSTLRPGAIAGIATGILLLIILCAGLGYFYWKANKKAKEKNREVAILSDRVSGCGFQRYIDELLADSNSSTGMILRHSAPAPAPEVAELPGISVETRGLTIQAS